MKTILRQFILLLLANATFGQTTNPYPVTKKDIITKSKAASINAATEQWMAVAQKNIKLEEYSFRKSCTVNNFLAANRSQKIGFTITASGYKTYPLNLSSKKLSMDTWQQGLSLTSISKAGTKLSFEDNYTITQERSILHYTYPGFSIEYINNQDGLRQNFIIRDKPAGNGNLEVRLKMTGNLTGTIINNGLLYKDKTGATKLFYTDLKVWDANHTIINATMQIEDNNTLAIVVKDGKAIYPLTIDPINKTPEWSSSADGILPSLMGQLAIDAAYGFSVAGLGDVNGDGYDDVAIGAPTMADVISGTGNLAAVGAVFVYYGSATGLPEVPDAVLQPTTAVTGALFGYSVSGGDINNDGKADIIVGAPMDVVTISIGGGSTASGTVGKVYVYNGGDLSTGTAPLLTLQLNGDGILENGVNLSVHALFGFSVAVTEDMNNDGRRDIIVGAPTYAGIKTGFLGNSILDVQSGGAFIFLSNGATAHSLVKLEPIKTSILGLPILQSNIDGLLFGYCVDGLGDYNGDGKPDVVVTAPAGIDMSSISGLLNGKLLQGSAIVYYGSGSGVNTNPGAILTATSGGLLTNIVGSIANLANMFGVSVKGLKNINGTRNGNILIGAPLGGTLMNILGLQLKTGTVSLFKKKNSSPAGVVAPDQVLSSPRNSNTVLELIQCNLLFGYSLDNAFDINCDGYSDIIVGEPASSGAQLLNANVAGGAAYVYLGKADGTYQAAPFWTLTATEDAFLGINGTSLLGYSVAGGGHTSGVSQSNKILVGTPSRSIDLGAGLLNVGTTLGTIFSLTSGNNGVGKSYLFDMQACGATLAVSLTKLDVAYTNGVSHLTWKTLQESNSSHYEIEHSTDGINFSYIGKVNAAGSSNTIINYQFDDINAKPGVNYYRLRMVDKNSQFVYSNIVVVNLIFKGTFITRVYPGPFNDIVNVTVSAEAGGPAVCSLFDNTGKMLANVQSSLHKGINTITLDNLGNLSKGAYFLQIRTGEITETKKIIK